MQLTTEKARNNALLISIHTPQFKGDEARESLLELARLVTTLGFKVVGTQSQKQSSTKTINVLGSGKLAELAQLINNQDLAENAEYISSPPSGSPSSASVDVLVFDCDLSPSQLRNVESQLGVEVFDRTGVIIEIFSRHARTRTARLQVEIARLNYLAPRLRESKSGNKERQMGKGSGESVLELERRKVRDKLAELRRELAAVQDEMQGRRTQRSELFCVALVGYTNAGKSSMMRALTGSEVLVQDKLFATLDTTVRALHPATQPRILVSDTVGFIKKLPHDLVASFHSTLEEAKDASLLLYVVDASDPSFRSQLDVVNNVLQEVGVDGIQKQLVMNKSDKLNLEQQQALTLEFPDAMFTSTLNPEDIDALHKYIVSVTEQGMIEDELLIPYTAKGIIGEIRSSMKVIDEVYEYEFIRLIVRSDALNLQRMQKRILDL
jgi:GTP-binding protein HflX